MARPVDPFGWKSYGLPTTFPCYGQKVTVSTGKRKKPFPHLSFDSRLMAKLKEAGNGILELTLDDLRKGADYETATLRDVMGSVFPLHEARVIRLWHPDGTRCRTLKDKSNGYDPPTRALPSRDPKWK